MDEQKIAVLMSIRGRAFGGAMDDEEKIDLMTRGELVATDGGWLLTYEETQPDENKSSTVLLQITPVCVTMTRLGEFGTTMVFNKERRFEGAYRTPYGELSMAVFATRVDIMATAEQGRILLEYQLDLQGQFAAMHELRIDYAANTEDAK